MQRIGLASVPVLMLVATLALHGQSDRLATVEGKDHAGEEATVCGRSMSAQYGETTKCHAGDPEQIHAQQWNAVRKAQALFIESQLAQPAPSASLAPAYSIPTHSLNSAESLIERAREAAFQYSGKLPHFICEESMSRYIQRRGHGEETRWDVVSAEIFYLDGVESYRNVKINDQPTDKSLEEIDGTWSTGEFASTLLEIFAPRADARFRSIGASPILGLHAQLYEFQVGRENSHWKVQFGSRTLTPAYGGSLWVDPKTARVLRIKMQARNMPSDFPIDTVESAVDYSYVTIAGTSFLLPVHADSFFCDRGSGDCSHNIIEFRNYHEFKVDSRILSPSK